MEALVSPANLRPVVGLGASEKIDWLEAALVNLPPAEFPVAHRFTQGLYSRTIFMPAGSVLTSKIHKTQHQFLVSQGHLTVYTEDGGAIEIRAPYLGTTEPGTRRALQIHEDTIWTTFHPTDETDLEKIEVELIQPHEIPPALEETKCLGSQ